MGIESDVAARQLDAITAAVACQRLRGLEQFGADAATAPIAAHVDAFEFAAPPTGVLEVLEDDHLADANDVTILFGDEDVATLSTSLSNRGQYSPV